MAIPVFRPSYGKEELVLLEEVLKSGWAGQGPKTDQFEKEFGAYVGSPHASAMNSCTAALHLAMQVAGVEGGEVITTPMTFVSTNHSILFNKAVPIFCDIEPDTLNIDARQIEKLITKKTKAIVTVHYGGHACDLDAIQEIAKKHKLVVIEDCAHAAGGEYKGKKLGSIGDLGCYSFHAVKNLACGDGGMTTTRNAEWDKRIRRLRWVGISKDTWKRTEIDQKYSWFYTVEELGYKYHMNDISAAIGLAQLKKLDAKNKRRKEITQIYNREFKNLPWLETPVQKDYANSSNHNYCAKIDPKHRDAFMAFLLEKGASTSVHYFPNHLYDLYKPYYRSLPVAESVWKKIVILPLFPDLTDSEVGLIVDAVKKFSDKI